MTKEKNMPDIKCLLEEIEQPMAAVVEGIDLLKDFFAGHQDVKQRQIFNSVRTNLDRACTMIRGLGETVKDASPKASAAAHFDVLQQIQQVCSTHDQMFLQRQLRYKVIASSDIPKAFANPDQIFVVLSHLVSNAIKFAPRGSDIEIKAREVRLRQGAGTEVCVVNESPDFTERDRYQIFEKFYATAKNGNHGKTEGLGLAVCREIMQRAGGQLWVDIPSRGKVSFAFVLPCAEVAVAKPKGHQTYKYDITISNFQDIKDSIGGEKIQQLLHRIEESVRKLVRYPIDVVATFESSGVISTIYETQENNASSVAARISQKLGAEEFKIGKTAIPVTFKYHLSILQ